MLAFSEPLPLLNKTRAQRLTSQARDLSARLTPMLGDKGVIVFPSHAVPAPRHNWSILRPFNFAYTAIWNVLELPVTQVPIGLCPLRNIPLGVQIVGAHGMDHVPIAVAQQLEKAFGGWTLPRPLQPLPDYLRQSGCHPLQTPGTIVREGRKLPHSRTRYLPLP